MRALVRLLDQLVRHRRKKVRSRRPAVLRCLHAIGATRVHLLMKWVVYFSILGPFGPRVGPPPKSSTCSRRPPVVERLEDGHRGQLCQQLESRRLRHRRAPSTARPWPSTEVIDVTPTSSGSIAFGRRAPRAALSTAREPTPTPSPRAVDGPTLGLDRRHRRDAVVHR